MKLSTILAIAKKDLLILARYPLGLIFNFLSPVFVLLPLLFMAKTFGATEYYLWLVLGTIFWTWVSQVVWSVGLAIRNEQIEGTLLQLILSPTELIWILIGKSIPSMLINMAVSIIGLAIVSTYFGINIHVPLLIVIFFAHLPLLYSLAFLLAGLTINIGEIYGLFQVILLGLLLLCGISQPTDVFSPTIKAFSSWIPLTWGVELFRDSIIQQKGVVESIPPLLKIFFTGVIFSLVSLILFKYLKRISLRSGNDVGGY